VSAIVAQEVPLVVQLPKGGLFSHVVLGAAGELDVGAEAQVQGTDLTLVTNAGELTTDLGELSAVQGDILSQAAVTLSEGALVDGSVTTSLPVTLLPGATVTGSITENAILIPPTTFDSTVKFGGSTTDVQVPPHGSVSIAPGAYNALSVAPHATLTFTAGTYTACG
jgi:hypothetical protein